VVYGLTARGFRQVASGLATMADHRPGEHLLGARTSLPTPTWTESITTVIANARTKIPVRKHASIIGAADYVT